MQFVECFAALLHGLLMGENGLEIICWETVKKLVFEEIKTTQGKTIEISVTHCICPLCAIVFSICCYASLYFFNCFQRDVSKMGCSFQPG